MGDTCVLAAFIGYCIGSIVSGTIIYLGWRWQNR